MSQKQSHYTAAQIAQVEQNAVKYFDSLFLEPVKIRARAGAYAELENVILWRELHEEIPHGAKVAAEREFAAAMMCSPQTLRRKLKAINGFGVDRLCDWINADVAWEHFATAHDIAETAKKSPGQLLDECVALGDGHGKTMTVHDMIAFALGEQAASPESYAAFGCLSRLAEIPVKLGWNETKVKRLAKLIVEIKELLR